ncbi:unnamed protein product [Allacma fusca]|uniref:Uncharacterized protein n=1 Tax=Allacma fusca TaxID=39272 RepID=A0A8J2K770_9HEXA|nr:unnamed protein product [Allacma fusca]
MKAWIALSFVAVALVAVVSANPEPPVPVYGAPAIVESHGGWGAPAPVSQGWSAPAPVSQGWGWKPKVRYLNLRIPIPQLPKIRLGIRAGIKASVSHGWGWQK